MLDEHRSRLYPDVPTGKEAIGTGWTMGAWRGIAAPKNLPKAVQVKLEAAVQKAYESKEYHDFMEQRGFGLRWAAPKEFSEMMVKSDRELGVAMKAVGLAK